MSDYIDSLFGQEDELDSIIREVRNSEIEQVQESAQEVTEVASETDSSEWSIEDIDRLLAGESREKPQELDSSLFSIRPIVEKTEEPEILDIVSGDYEVEGQETLFDDEPQEFDLDLFDLETVVIPEEKEEEHKPLDYKARFFSRLHLENTKEEIIEPEGPVDKSGFVIRKDEGLPGEEDLENVPTIIAAEDVGRHAEEKTKIVKEATQTEPVFADEDDVEGQIVLNEFADVPDEVVPEQTDEEDVEENLWKRRKQKAKIFKVDGINDEEFGDGFDEIDAEEEKYEPEITVEDEETVEENIEDSSFANEYTDASQKNLFYEKLGRKVDKAKKSLISSAVIAAVIFLLSVIPPIAEKLSAETSLFTRNSMILCVVQAILLISAVAFDSERFFDTLTDLKKGKITGSTPVAFALIVALVENALSAATGADSSIFSAAAVMGVLLLKVSDYINAKRIYGNFSICAFNYDHNMSAVHTFDNESEIFELGRGLLMGNAEMLYSSNVSFPTDFMKKSGEETDDKKYITVSLIASAVCSLIAAVVTLIVAKADLMTCIASFAGCFCVSAPVTSAFIPAFIARVANHRLNSEGTMIVSLNEAEKTASANAVVIDSADIFDRESCTMHGMKEFKTLRMDAILLYASAMIIKSGGPLKECFEKVIDGRQDLLPPVRELVYEDKMGISARIYDQKVLLGNRNMLVQHNIKAPDKEFENKYLHSGHKVIYLACNEQLAALFVVSYSVDENMKAQLKKLENNGIQILVRTNDVNVTEELISKSFGLSQENFKILSSVAGRLYKRRKDNVSETLPAGIIHDGKADSMIRAIASSCSMASAMKMGRILRAVLSVLAIGAGTAVACMGAFGLTGAVASLLMLAEVVITSGVLWLTNK